MTTTETEEQFRHDYPKADENWDVANITWDELCAIREDYQLWVPALQNTARSFATALQDVPGVHSTRVRVKDTDHLLAKIVRKRSPDRDINLQNYRQEMTDFIGARALHLFKEDWVDIHDNIIAIWDQHEPPTAHIRKGDDTSLYDQVPIPHDDHPDNYRSVHYLVKTNFTKETHIVEVQVRTISEEAWGEIDHLVRYPNFVGEPVMEAFCALLSRLTGSADELASLILRQRKGAEESLQKMAELEATTQEQETQIAAIKQELEEVTQKLEISKEEKEKLTAKIVAIPETRRSREEISLSNDLMLRAARAMGVLDNPRNRSQGGGFGVGYSGRSGYGVGFEGPAKKALEELTRTRGEEPIEMTLQRAKAMLESIKLQTSESLPRK